jgi:hypothetical protein
MKTINVDVGLRDISIDEAMGIGKEKAASELGISRDETVIVSWFDCRADKHSPNLISGWEDYGKSHGATLKVELNDGEFVFLCEEGLPH